MKIKTERVNAELAKQIAQIIASDVKDPRMGNSIVGVTKVYSTPDLKYATVYVSVYSKDDAEIKAAFDTVVRSKSYIRNKLKDAVNMRLVPDLNFKLDDSVDYSIKIGGILSKIEIPKEDTEI